MTDRLGMIRRRQQSPWRATIAVAVIIGGLGVIAYVAAAAIIEESFDRLIDPLFAVNGHIFLQAAEGDLPDNIASVDRLDRIKGVKLAIPLIESASYFVSPTSQTGGVIRGIAPSDLARLTGIAGHLKSGTLGGEGLVVGQQLAKTLDVQVGDSISVLTAKAATGSAPSTPRIKRYRIDAIFDAEVATLNATYAFMPLKEAQAYFDKDGQATVIEIVLQNQQDTVPVARRIEELAIQPLIVTDWRETNKSFLAAIQTEGRLWTGLIAGVIFFVVLCISCALIIFAATRESRRRI